MEGVKVDSMNNKDNNANDLILAVNSLINETGLIEFEELKESIDNIHLEANKIILNKNEIKHEEQSSIVQKDDYHS